LTELERALGDCGSCEAALNFWMGRFSKADLSACTDCQVVGLPQRRRLLDAMDAEGKSRERAVADNRKWFNQMIRESTSLSTG
jgi:hypothetical protein